MTLLTTPPKQRTRASGKGGYWILDRTVRRRFGPSGQYRIPSAKLQLTPLVLMLTRNQSQRSSPMYLQLPEAYGIEEPHFDGGEVGPHEERKRCRSPHYVHVPGLGAAAVTGARASLEIEPLKLQTPSKTTIPAGASENETQRLMEPARLPPPGLFLPPPTECSFTSPPPLGLRQTANREQELTKLSLQIDWLKKHIAALEAYADAERSYVKLARACALAQPACEVPSPRPGAVPGIPARPVEALTKPAQPPASCGIRSGLNSGTGSLEIYWTVTARKLTSSDRVFTSPGFDILRMPFKMLVYARPTDGGRTGSFRNSSGFGHVHLKCEAEAPNEDLNFEFRLSVGARSEEEEAAVHTRVQHDFGRMATWGSPGAPALNLSAAVDRHSMTLQILLEVWAESR